MASLSPRSRSRRLQVRSRTAASKRQGGGTPDGRGERKTAIRVALIGAIATVLAAIIGGVFALNQTTPVSQSIDPKQLLAVRAVSFAAIRGTETITVTGIAKNLGGEIYAVAMPLRSSAPLTPSHNRISAHRWFTGGPADVGNDGTWTIEIKIVPPNYNLTVNAVEMPMFPCPENGCGFRSYLAVNGPHGSVIIRASPTFHATQ